MIETIFQIFVSIAFQHRELSLEDKFRFENIAICYFIRNEKGIKLKSSTSNLLLVHGNRHKTLSIFAKLK